MGRPLDRLGKRIDERQAMLALYPPRALRSPGCSSAIVAIRPSDPTPPSEFADGEPERLDDEPQGGVFPFWRYP